jgi:plasmid replication initiation protein
MPRKKKIEPAKEITIVEDATVKVKNELVNGKYSLSLLEMKMVMALAAHINKNADDFETCSIRVRELGEYMGLSEDKCYQSIKATAKKLLSRSLFFEWYKTTNSRKKSWLGASWFDYIFYDDEESTVEFRFATMIKPMLLQISEAYAQLECKPLMAFKCMYSNRFLLYVVEWEKIQPHTIKIEDLRELLQLGKKYKQFGEFRTYVIEPAVREINALTEYEVTAEPVKRGRRYDSYNFYIKRKTAKAKIKPKKKAVDTDAVPAEWTEDQNALYNDIVGLGLLKKDAKNFINEKALEEIRISVEYAKKQDAAGKVKNFGAYLYKAIADGYGVATARGAAQEEAARKAQEKDRIDNMTPEQKAAYMSHQDMLKQAAELTAAGKAEKAEEREVNWENPQKIKEMYEIILNAKHEAVAAENAKRKKINQ